jgi:hypothetical protein
MVAWIKTIPRSPQAGPGQPFGTGLARQLKQALRPPRTPPSPSPHVSSSARGAEPPLDVISAPRVKRPGPQPSCHLGGSEAGVAGLKGP